MKKAEQLIGGPVAQLFSFVRINVAHHQRHIFLDEVVEACFHRPLVVQVHSCPLISSKKRLEDEKGVKSTSTYK